MSKLEDTFGGFEVANFFFSYNLETEYAENGQSYWMPSNSSGFGIDFEKAFRTPEACEKYMRDTIRESCEDIIKEMDEI